MKLKKFSIFFIEFAKNLNTLIDSFQLKKLMLKDFFERAITNDLDKLINLGSILDKKKFDENGTKLRKKFTDLKKGMLGDEEHKFSYDFFRELHKSYTYNSYVEFERINDLILKLTEFEKYLYNCFKYIILKRPDILDNRSIKVGEFKFLQERGIEIVEELAAEDFLHDIFYKNYKLIFERAIKPLGIKHSIKEELVKILQGIKLIRNQFIHANGRVTTVFLRKLNELELPMHILKLNKLELNSKIELHDELLQSISFTLFIIGLEFDMKFIEVYPELIAKIGL